MSVKLSPYQFFGTDSSGDPLSGYQLFTYVQDSSTKLTTYQDSDGSTPHSNPIVLSTLGFPSAPIWLTEGSAYKFVLADPNDTDPPVGTVRTFDNIIGVNDTSISIDEWIGGSLTPTYISATSFSLEGDQTTEFHIGRRLKTSNTGGTIFSTITNSVYGAATTITVTNDSGSLDSGLSSVSYGIVSSSNTSLPGVTISEDDYTFQGNITVGGFQLSHRKITSGTVSNEATLDLTDLTSTYRTYELVFDGLLPQTDATVLNFRVSTDNGSTFKSGASDYGWVYSVSTSTPTSSENADVADSEISLDLFCGNGANEDIFGKITIFNPAASGQPTAVIWELGAINSVSNIHIVKGYGIYLSDTAVDAIRLLFSSGNIATMNYTLYGVLA